MVRWTAERALYAEGIGHIDQYGSYLETLWSKGVVYFLRDYLFHDIDEPGSRGRSPTISGRSQEVGSVCRFTVSSGPSAVSPVGPDLVGTSSAEGKRVSPQGARCLRGPSARRVSPRPVFRCPIPPTRGACPFGGSSLGHSVEWGMPAAHVCVLLSDPPCDVRLIINLTRLIP